MTLAWRIAELYVLGRRMTDTSSGKMSRMLIKRVLHLFEDVVEMVQLSLGPKIRQRWKNMRRCSVTGYVRSSIMVHSRR